MSTGRDFGPSIRSLHDIAVLRGNASYLHLFLSIAVSKQVISNFIICNKQQKTTHFISFCHLIGLECLYTCLCVKLPVFVCILVILNYVVSEHKKSRDQYIGSLRSALK